MPSSHLAMGDHSLLSPLDACAPAAQLAALADARDAFAVSMARIGGFEPNPLLAIAVSGGADSLSLALLAHDWACTRGGSVIGLVVDHGLRTESAEEAAATISRLHSSGIQARLLTLSDLFRGPGLAARARAGRYRILTEACEALGCLHLLLGHQRGDQAETLMIRILGGSRSDGLAAMPLLRESRNVRLLRPLLGWPRNAPRDFLRHLGIGWVEDPSNRDRHALRTRMRDTALAAEAELAAAAALAGRQRCEHETRVAAELASRVTLRPEGFALLTPGRITPDALAALLRTLGGGAFPPGSRQLELLAETPGPATLGGVRILPAGRLGHAWLLAREEAAMQACVDAGSGVVWDRRFRLSGDVPSGLGLGAVGQDAVQLRRHSALPDIVLRTLPALRRGNSLVAVPHIRYFNGLACGRLQLRFLPAQPMAGAPFLPHEQE
jgi:tRNA(Ile)-lysidine synthase